jgi:glycosyltransferase involved in cell wall biosynthesis
MHPLKIFISAYACEPGLGSEIGVGWHWVLEMSQYFELWVLTRESNRHSIEPWITAHPEYSCIHFLYYDWPKWARWWKKGLRGVRTYYNLWQWCTNSIVKRTMQAHDIRVFHHLTYGNVQWAVSRYGQRQFFIWGPVGGLETIPQEYSEQYGRKERWLESVRRWSVRLARWNPGLKGRCCRADLILCKTAVTRDALPAAVQSRAVLFTDVAADVQLVPAVVRKADGVTRLITVGHLDAWRGFDLVIEALAVAVRTCPDLKLTVVGAGPDRERLKGLVQRLRLEAHVTMTGTVTMEEYRRRMSEADVVVNAALKEGAVTVSFDAMAMGKPLLCLDTTGYTRYFRPEYAVLIPRTRRDEVVTQLTAGMLRLTDAGLRQRMGQAAQAAARQVSWAQHGSEIQELIDKAYRASMQVQ